MTTINMMFSRPAVNGNTATPKGTLIWTPTLRHNVIGSPDNVILPLGFPVRVESGEFTIEVEPSGMNWVWKVEENFTGLRPRKIYFAVPDVLEIDYTDLIQVDPKTLEPSAAPDPVWWAALEAAQLGVSATLSPDDPNALDVIFPSWRGWPNDPDSIMMPVEVAP